MKEQPTIQISEAEMAMMDKMSSKAREGQMPWAKPGIGNDAENALLQRRRKNWRERFLPGWRLQKS